MDLLNNLLISSNNKLPRKLVVAAAADLPVLKAIQAACEYNLIIPILVGNTDLIKSICHEISFDYSNYEIIDEPDATKSAILSVKLIRDRKADILMKGLVATAPLLKALISKEAGLRSSPLLSHFALFESKFYHKLFAVTDAAMNIAPSLEEKVDIIQNAVNIMHKLGIEKPKVALITPLEYINKKIESTVHADKLVQMNREGIINGCIIDGPLALDNAISKEAAFHKGITGEVVGDADILLVHDLDAGNVLYKSLIFLGGALSASVIAGAKIPVVLTSRADSEKSKLLSIALATKLDGETIP